MMSPIPRPEAPSLLDPSGRQPTRILLVEDNPAHARLMLHAMREDRLRNPVHHVSDGEEALDFLRRAGRYAEPGVAPRPDLILLDLRLPGMSGLEVLRAVKSDADLATIPVVVLTSSGDPDDVVTSYANRANSYVSKPLDFERFRAIVRELDFYWSLVNRVPQAH